MASTVNRTGLTTLRAPGQPIVDIIFVHGFGGHPRNTWACKPTSGSGHGTLKRWFSGGKKYAKEGENEAEGVFWPLDLLPADCPDARILTWGYDSNVSNFFGGPANKNNIFQYAKDLLYALNRERTDCQKRSLIFVAHSLGGILVKEVLRRAGAEKDEAKDLYSIYASTTAIIFLGTPHRGSPWADFGETIRRIVAVVGFDTSDKVVRALQIDSAELEVCQEDFMRLYERRVFQVRTFQEAQGIQGTSILGMNKKVVDNVSSLLTGSAAERPETINANHMDMCRFTSKEDEGYKKVGGELRVFVSDTRKALQENENLEERMQREQLEEDEDESERLTDQEQECLQSLFFREMTVRRYDITAASPNTCTWLREHPKYVTWLRQGGRLCIAGKPGAGKSTLMKFVLQNFENQGPNSNSIVLAFFFHGTGVPLQRTQVGLYRSLLHQLLMKCRSLRREFQSGFERKQKTQGKVGQAWDWHVRELQEAFSSAVTRDARTRSICLFVDALDECGGEAADELVSWFQQLTIQSPSLQPGLNICFSCRHFPILAVEGALEVCVENENRADISSYTRTQFQSCRDMPEVVGKDIIERASGVFQWVRLVVPSAIKLHRSGKSLKNIQKKLKEVPSNLDGLYSQILRNIDCEDRPKTTQLMQWVCFAERPLSLRELRYAMAFDSDIPYASQKAWELSDDYIENDDQMAKLVTTWSGGLVEVMHKTDELRKVQNSEGSTSDTEDWKDENSESELVQFIHQSVKDFLREQGFKNIHPCFPSNPIGQGNYNLFRACMNYSKVEEMHEIDSLYREDLVYQLPFIEYAVCSAFLHAQKAENEICLNEELLGLFEWPSYDVPKLFISAYEELTGCPLHVCSNQCFRPGTTLLHVASAYYLHSLMQLLLDNGAEVNTRNDTGMTALHIAADAGHGVIVGLLLDKGADVTVKDDQEWTALHRAVRNNHEGIVQLLLENGADVSAKSYRDATVLYEAVCNSHERTVRLLLETENRADPIAENNSSSTALCEAASHSSEGVMPLLVDKNANPGNTWELPALHKAVCNNHQVMVRLLLKKGADVTLKDDEGRTAFYVAVENNQDGMIRLLLEYELDLALENTRHPQPLHKAIDIGHEGIARSLLERGADVAAKDKDGETALSKTIQKGHQGIVRVLLEYRADVAFKEKDGYTALHKVVRENYEGIVELLLGKGVDVTAKSRMGITALFHVVCSKDHEETVRLLLAMGADVTAKDNKAGTALHYAARHGHEEIVQLLLEIGADVTAKDDEGWTALHFATRYDHEKIVRLLLKKGADVTAKTNNGWTALRLAAYYSRNEEIVRLLLEQGADVTAKDNNAGTVLHYAARYDHEEIVRLLLEKGADVTAKDKYNTTALDLAVFRGYDEIVQLLREKEADIIAMNGRGETALRIAATN